MATGSTEAAFTSNQSLPCFNSSLLKSDSKYWNGAQVLATTSEDSFWEDDPEEKIKKKVLACKSVFHMGRCLQIKHLPRDVTETVSLIYITLYCTIYNNRMSTLVPIVLQFIIMFHSSPTKQILTGHTLTIVYKSTENEEQGVSVF